MKKNVKIISKRQLEINKHIEWRNRVKRRDKFRCQVCERNDCQLQTHHLIPKTIKVFMYDDKNGITLCSHHHRLGRYSAHQNPLWFVDWLKNNRPMQYELAMERLKDLREGVVK